MNLKRMIVQATEFKLDEETGLFTAYANTKNVIDHAQDRAIDGCYTKSIERHKTLGTMPKMLWSHNPYALPVGAWKSMNEDIVGLLMGGKLSKTSMGSDIEILAKDGSLDSFSIGYTVQKEKWNKDKNCNDLIEIDIKEVSWVNFACNEESVLQEIKAQVLSGELPSKRELQNLLREVAGFSKSQASSIVDYYNPQIKEKTINLNEIVANLDMFN